MYKVSKIRRLLFFPPNEVKPSTQFCWNPKVFDLPAKYSRWQCNSISRPLSARGSCFRGAATFYIPLKIKVVLTCAYPAPS